MNGAGIRRFCTIGLAGFVAAIVGSSALAVPPPRLLRDPAQGGKQQLPRFEPLPALGSDKGEVAGGFSSFNVNLLSHIPLQDFPGGQFAANDCWSYVSSSGREYALVGLTNGTGVVEVTDPVNPVIVDVVPDANSFWSDLEVLGDYCFNVTESSGGMQVIDLTQVDNGLVSVATALTDDELESSHSLTVHAPSQTVFLNGSNAPTNGLIAVDVSNPLNPQIVGIWTEHYVHDVFVQRYDNCPTDTRSGQCDIAFVFDVASRVWIVDVTDKANMTTITTLTHPNWRISHQGWITPDLKYILMDDEGDETFFGIPSTLYVIDVQDLDAPFVFDTFTNGETSIDHNIIVRGDFAFQANYTTGLRVYDISDIANIQEVGFFDTFPFNDNQSFNGAWSQNPMLPSGIVLVSDINGGLFVLDAFPATGCQQDSHCNDHNDCTTDTCLAGACQHADLPSNTPCDDSDVCTFGGLCNATGACVLNNYNDVPCVNNTVCGPGICDTGAGFCICEPCVTPAPVLTETLVTAKNRHLSFVPQNAGSLTAIRVVLANMPAPFTGLEGSVYWVTNPITTCENSGQVTPPPDGCGPAPGLPSRTYQRAALQTTPNFRDWSGVGMIDVQGPAVIPGGDYVVQHIALTCYNGGVQRFSQSRTLKTSRWGDVVGNCSTLPCTPPDGTVGNIDIVAVLDKFKNAISGPRKARSDVEPRLLDQLINISDVTMTLNAFTGDPYPFAGP